MSTAVPKNYSFLHFNTIAISHVPLPPPVPHHLHPQALTVVTLNRPKHLNAFTKEMALELERAFTVLSADERVRVIVLTGAGRAFCAGADLNSGLLGTNEQPFEQHRDECVSSSIRV